MIPERLFWAWVDYAVNKLTRLQAELEELRARVSEHEARIEALERKVAALEEAGVLEEAA